MAQVLAMFGKKSPSLWVVFKPSVLLKNLLSLLGVPFYASLKGETNRVCDRRRRKKKAQSGKKQLRLTPVGSWFNIKFITI